MNVILDIREVEIRRITVRGQLRVKSSQDPPTSHLNQQNLGMPVIPAMRIISRVQASLGINVRPYSKNS
jgi:hypothetical protein